MSSLPAHRLAVLAGLLFATLVGAFAQPIEVADVVSAPEADIVARLADSHPAAYLAFAERLWYQARRDEAVVWLYVGQIRYRLYLAANPKLAATEQPRFKHLTDTIGEPIERYAGGNVPRWRGQIAAALTWDRENPNGCTSQQRFASEWADARNVLGNLMLYLNRHAFEFNKQREQDGIGETGMTSPAGPYVEVRKPQMPHDWPALLASTSLPMLTGYYVIEDTSIAEMFFPDAVPAVATANNLQFAVEDDDRHITITARRDNTFLSETRITVAEESDAIVYTRELVDGAAGLSQGHRTVHFVLRRNEIGDLIIQADSLTDGMYPGRKFQVHLDITKWYRAERVPAGDEPGH